MSWEEASLFNLSTQHLPCTNQRMKPQNLMRPIRSLCCTWSPKREQLRLSSNINVPTKWWSMVSCIAKEISQCPGHHLLSTLQNPHFTRCLFLSWGFLSITFFLCGWPHLILHRKRKKLEDTSRASKHWPELPSSLLPVSMAGGALEVEPMTPSLPSSRPLLPRLICPWSVSTNITLSSKASELSKANEKKSKLQRWCFPDSSDPYPVMMSIDFCLPSWSLNLLRT